MLVDSHCHLNMLDFEQLSADLDATLSHARQVGVNHFLCVGTTLENASEVLAIAKQYSDVSASVGLHPNEECPAEPSVDQLCELAQDEKIVAIGETGLDYFRSDQKQAQQERFVRHIEAAKRLNKPLIIHTREAKEDTLALLKSEQASQAGGVIHCFTEDWETAQAAMELDFYISFSGILTFKNAHQIQEAAKKVPMEKILIETDSPYLAPVPYRGKTNQPSYVKEVAQFLATLKGISFDEVAKTTSANFYRLFLKRELD